MAMKNTTRNEKINALMLLSSIIKELVRYFGSLRNPVAHPNEHPRKSELPGPIQYRASYRFSSVAEGWSIQSEFAYKEASLLVLWVTLCQF